MEKIIGIYCITNLINNKKYIGQSINIDNRWKDHKKLLNNNKHYNKHLQKSWITYGKDNFKFEILSNINRKDQLILNILECFYISFYKTLNKEYGYNMKEGGTNGGLTEEAKLKISLSKLGKPRSEKVKDNLRRIKKGNKIWLGRSHTEKSKEKMRKTKLGKKASEETKTKMSILRKGKKFTKEHKDKMSIAQLGEKNHMYGKRGNLNVNSKKVLYIETNIVYESIHEASKITKVNRTSIGACCRGEINKAGGFHWMYYEG